MLTHHHTHDSDPHVIMDFFVQAEDGIRYWSVTGVQTCALPISRGWHWYTDPILERVYRKSRPSQFVQSIEEIVRFEKMLADEGALLLKFWFHLSKEKQKKRLKALEQDPKTRWRVTETDWRHYKLYDPVRKGTELALRPTPRASAPWILVQGHGVR